MFHRRWLCPALLLSTVAFAGSEPKTEKKVHWPENLPMTTSSPLARRNFEHAMRNFEDYRLDQSLLYLQQATKADPKFAQAYILIAKIARDPVEQAAARRQAKSLAGNVTPGEQLLIRWIAGAQEDDYLPAIVAMNDLLAMFPDDHRLAFLAGDWLTLQGRYEQAAEVLRHALALWPDYPAALNDLGYTYAYAGDFDKAFATMERYAALKPDEPNPRDSYGEILRMAGKFDAALEQYRMSVRIDPNFGSELGIADTYAVMGREQEARDEYDRAIVFAGSQNDKVTYELQSAVTWIRENNHKQSEKALAEVAKHAHAAGLAMLEAEAQRVLGMYEPEYPAALKHLQMAQQVLQEPHELSELNRNEEQARILRIRATRAAEAKDMQNAVENLNQLETMAGKSRSQAIQLCYQGAAGAVLMAQGTPADAIAHLEEDSRDPFSMRLLWEAYNSTGAHAQAQAMAAKLAALNVATAEQALVVPQFRTIMLSQAGQH